MIISDKSTATMYKTHKSLPQTCCERYQKHLCAFANTNNSGGAKVTVRKYMCSNSEKSCSTCTINNIKNTRVMAPKKTTKSYQNLGHHLMDNIDFCKTCGDVASRSDNMTSSKVKITSSVIESSVPLKKINRHQTTSKNIYKNHKSQVQQFYRNENFKQSTHSLNATDNVKKKSLKTISEQTENKSQINTKSSVFETHPKSDDELGFMDCEKNLTNIKEFRNKNYFECHSTKLRINSKSSSKNSKHECLYRFHLNERLFPVPFNTDNHNNIRCIECSLPLDKKKHGSNVNGMIQAKVKINDEVQDMLLMLPVNDSLIIKQKRNKIQNDEEYLYFGLIKLDLNGDSIFNRTLPENSLALRYQKGYKKLSRDEKYTYESLGENDVIII